MILLRRSLVWLRDEFDERRKDLLVKVFVAVLVCGLVTVLVDTLLPFGGIPNLLRSLLLVPTSIAIFSLAYVASLWLHGQRMEHDEDWVPYRARFSPSWRRRIAVVLAALLLVLAQAIEPGPAYTFTSSILGAIIIATMAFLRTSKQEASREELGIPDSRDVIYDAEKRRFEREQALKRASKRSAKADREKKAAKPARNKSED